MGNNIFQKSKVQRSTSVVASTLSQHYLSFRNTGIAQHYLSFRDTGITDFVISKFVFANIIIIFSVKSFQNIIDVCREAVVSPLNCGILFLSMIYWIIKTHAILLHLCTYLPHNLLEKYDALGCFYIVVTVLSH